jgi:DNA-binding XRE family transcriptional regulator
MSQADLSASAQVSRRWLSDLEGGKPTAEIGLVFKVLHSLELTLEASPVEHRQGAFDLDDIIRSHGQLDAGESSRG